jgi:hypothetical protein
MKTQAQVWDKELVVVVHADNQLGEEDEAGRSRVWGQPGKHFQNFKDGNWDRDADFMSSWTRDPMEMPETHLAEVKHQRETKIQQSKPLDHGRLLYATI